MLAPAKVLANSGDEAMTRSTIRANGANADALAGSIFCCSSQLLYDMPASQARNMPGSRGIEPIRVAAMLIRVFSVSRVEIVEYTVIY